VNKLLEALEQKRGDTSIVEFAEGLGMHFSSYYRLLRGERGIGADLERRIMRRYPELTLVFLQQFSPSEHQEVPTEHQE